MFRKSFLSLLGLSAILVTGCGDDSITGSEVRMDRIVADVRYFSTSHDCDPNPDNPGDFTAYIQVYHVVEVENGFEEKLLATSPKFKVQLSTKNGSAGATLPVGKAQARAEVPRVDGEVAVVEIHVEERDPGLDAALVRRTRLTFNAEEECWMNQGECNPTLFRGAETFREDEFHLFNPDDEGCDIGAEWMITTEAAN